MTKNVNVDEYVTCESFGVVLDLRQIEVDSKKVMYSLHRLFFSRYQLCLLSPTLV